MISIEEVDDNRSRINWRDGDASIGPAMTKGRDVVMTHYIRIAFAGVRDVPISRLGRRCLICCWVCTTIASSPPRKPSWDRGQKAAISRTTEILDSLVSIAVEFENGKRRSGGLAVAEISVRVEGARYRSKCGKRSTVVRRTC